MAMVPQKQMRITACEILDPPALAATIADIARKTMEKEYWMTTINCNGANKATNTGKIPPQKNEPAEATAANIGLAWVISLMPSSSLA